MSLIELRFHLDRAAEGFHGAFKLPLSGKAGGQVAQSLGRIRVQPDGLPQLGQGFAIGPELGQENAVMMMSFGIIGLGGDSFLEVILSLDLARGAGERGGEVVLRGGKIRLN